MLLVLLLICLSIFQRTLSFSFFMPQGVNPESGCKGKHFKSTHQMFLKKNSRFIGNFSQKLM